MVATLQPITKKMLTKLVKEAKANGLTGYPTHKILQETSVFGPEIRETDYLPVVLDHPKRNVFASLSIDANLNITRVA